MDKKRLVEKNRLDMISRSRRVITNFDESQLDIIWGWLFNNRACSV